MGKHVDIIQIGSHIGNSVNDPIYNKNLDNKSLIIIEPIPFLYNILLHNYKVKAQTEKIAVECLNIAVSDIDGTLDIFAPSELNIYNDKPFWLSQLGSTNPNHFNDHHIFENYPDFKVEKIEVKCKTLNTLITERNITSIDTLYIDTEGHDYIILKAFDLSLVKPKHIIFENKHTDGCLQRGKNYKELIKHFVSNGYKIVEENSEDTHIELIE